MPKILLLYLQGRVTLSGGGLIIEFDKVAPVCFGKSFRPLMVS